MIGYDEFQAFVDWINDEEERLQRQRWIDALRAGKVKLFSG